jgi:hypothetical protein
MKFTFTIAIAMAVLSSNSQSWVKEANNLSGKPSTKEVVLGTQLKESNKKMKLSGFDFEEAFSSIFMCDFLVNVIPSGSGISTFSSYAIAKFPFDGQGGMAYIVENRFFDVFASNSEILRHYLVTVSGEGELLYPFILGQGGTYFFRNGEMGSCAQHEDANALYLEWESKYQMNSDFTFIVQKNYKTKDVLIDDNYNIIKILDEHESRPRSILKVWVDENGEIQEEEFKK